MKKYLLRGLIVSTLIALLLPMQASGLVAEAAPVTPRCGVRTWDVKDLAKKILACESRISFQMGYQRTAFEQVARNGKEYRSYCGGYRLIDAGMLRTLLAMTDTYVIVIGSMAYDHTCDGGYHPLGKAVDINGVAGNINGKWVKTNYGRGRNIIKADFRTPLLRSFYADLSRQLIAQTKNSKGPGHGALGQYACFNPKPTVKSGVKKITDSRDDYYCNHIHLDVR